MRINVSAIEREVARSTTRLPLEWAALEELTAFVQWSDGDVGTRVLALPQPLFVRAAFLLYVLGWERDAA